MKNKKTKEIIWKNSNNRLVASVKKQNLSTPKGHREMWTAQVFYKKDGYYNEFVYPSDAINFVEKFLIKLKLNDVCREDL